MVNKAINVVIEIVGSQQKLADAYEVKQPSVWVQLHEKKKVSAENTKRIELTTERDVPTYQTRPDSSNPSPHPNQTA